MKDVTEFLHDLESLQTQTTRMLKMAGVRLAGGRDPLAETALDVRALQSTIDRLRRSAGVEE